MPRDVESFRRTLEPAEPARLPAATRVFTERPSTHLHILFLDATAAGQGWTAIEMVCHGCAKGVRVFADMLPIGQKMPESWNEELFAVRVPFEREHQGPEHDCIPMWTPPGLGLPVQRAPRDAGTMLCPPEASIIAEYDLRSPSNFGKPIPEPRKILCMEPKCEKSAVFAVEGQRKGAEPLELFACLGHVSSITQQLAKGGHATARRLDAMGGTA